MLEIRRLFAAVICRRGLRFALYGALMYTISPILVFCLARGYLGNETSFAQQILFPIVLAMDFPGYVIQFLLGLQQGWFSDEKASFYVMWLVNYALYSAVFFLYGNQSSGK